MCLQEVHEICYDVKYALRLCAEYGHKRACVHIYSLMGLYEEAVDMALQVSSSQMASRTCCHILSFKC